MNTPSKLLPVEIGGNSYSIKFPNTGEQMDIDLLKVQLSDGKYEALKYSVNKLLADQATVIETIATFNILIPQLKKDLNVKSMRDLELGQMNQIVKVYEDEFLPWYEEWITILKADKSEDVSE
jgi:hypothetical protein